MFKVNARPNDLAARAAASFFASGAEPATRSALVKSTS